MSDASTPPQPFDPAELLAKIESLTRTVEELRNASADSDIRPGKVVYKSERATTLLQYPLLQEQYPAITQTNFFNSVLPKGHDHFDWSDFHYTEGMVYKPPAVLEHQVLTLLEADRKHEANLVRSQELITNATRMYNTFADEIVDSDDLHTDLGQRTLVFLNTLRILAANDASLLSSWHKEIYLRHMALLTSEPNSDAILTLEDLAKRRATAELVTKTFAKPKDNNIKSSFNKKSKFKKTAPEGSVEGQDNKKSMSGKKGESSGSRGGSGKSGSTFKNRKFPKNNNPKSTGDKGNGSEKEQQ
ncbi:hypothetical protein CPC16_003470 [Podila verticillata]|nr:hypothetical protein CPC16_003470 [Podila verticillata]